MAANGDGRPGQGGRQKVWQGGRTGPSIADRPVTRNEARTSQREESTAGTVTRNGGGD